MIFLTNALHRQSQYVSSARWASAVARAVDRLGYFAAAWISCFVGARLLCSSASRSES
jgi:hypothetical protein